MLNQQYQKILKENLLFFGFSEAEFAQIITKTKLLELKKSQIIFQENQLANHFFLVVEGQIKLTVTSAQGDEKTINIISAGSSFAEAVMFLKFNNYPLNAIALKNSSVLRIDASHYLSILKNSPESCFNVMGQLSQKLHWMLSEINNLKLHDGTYRLIHFLLSGLQKTRTPSKVCLSVSKLNLASRLSIQPETLSRIFNKLSQEGLLEVHNDYVVLLNPIELKNKLEN